MKDKILKQIASVLGFAVLSLLIFAFIKAEINPLKWNMGSRFLAVLFWLLPSVLSIAVINE